MAKMQPFWWFLSPNKIEVEEPLDDGYFKNKGEVWTNIVTEDHGGGYFDRE